MSWIFTIVSIAVSCSGLDTASRGLIPLLIVTIGLLTVYFENHRQALALYLISKTLTNTLLRIETVEKDKADVAEMKSMMANVAHDLKTVSYE